MKKALLIDIGGTKTKFEFMDIQEKYMNADYPDFLNILSIFLSKNDVKPDIIGIAAAGPVDNNQCTMTNLPWIISKDTILKEFFPKMSKENFILLNDLEASAYYPQSITEDSKNMIHITKDIKGNPYGNYAVVSSGTGLGVSFAVFDKQNKKYCVSPSEGGHAILGYVSNIPVTNEFFLSGEGLIRIYHSIPGNTKEIANTKELYLLAENKDKHGLEAIRIFFEYLGLFSMNLALTILPEKGIYFSGGIITNFYKFANLDSFLKNFRNNPEMNHLLKKIPLVIINSQDTPIKGLKTYIDTWYF